MSYELDFSARSEEETKSALAWYDEINPELGDRFYTELLDIYGKLAINPEAYSFISSIRYTAIRDVKLPSFPYVVIYEIIEKSVKVISVMCTHRKPFIT